MSGANVKPKLVILPCYQWHIANCALCGRSDHMSIPIDVFTEGGDWVCCECAEHEWGGGVVEYLRGVDGRPKPIETLAFQLRCTEQGFQDATVTATGGDLVRLAVRKGMSPTLAKIITDELLRRYDEQYSLSVVPF